VLTLSSGEAWAQAVPGDAPSNRPPAVRVGRASIHERGRLSLTLIVDGVECGSTPWDGTLEEGTHEAYATSATFVTPVLRFTVVAGAAVDVEVVASARASTPAATPSSRGASATPSGVAAAATPSSLGASSGRARATKGALPREAPHQGGYGGFAVQLLLEPSGTQSDVCSAPGVTQCSTSSPIGGGLLVYAGYAIDPVGIDFMAGLQVDAAGAKGKAFGTSENLTIPRLGGIFALRARLASQGPAFGASLAAGFGVAVRDVAFGAVGVDSKTYVSPGIVLDGAVHARFAANTSMSFGLMLWGENAGEGVTLKVNPLPQPVHVVASTQLFALPYLGVEFGP
jgi:hypothetical protein